MPEGEKLFNLTDPVLRREASRALRRRKPPAIWNAVLYFPDRHYLQVPTSVTSLFLDFFENAKLSIQICHYFISFPPFEELILRKKKEGLCVEVVTDPEMLASHNNSSCRAFELEGIPVYKRNIDQFVNHKFILIDDEAVIITAMNLTTQAMTAVDSRREDLVVSTGQRMVAQYSLQYRFLVHNYERPDISDTED